LATRATILILFEFFKFDPIRNCACFCLKGIIEPFAISNSHLHGHFTVKDQRIVFHEVLAGAIVSVFPASSLKVTISVLTHLTELPVRKLRESCFCVLLYDSLVSFKVLRVSIVCIVVFGHRAIQHLLKDTDSENGSAVVRHIAIVRQSFQIGTLLGKRAVLSTRLAVVVITIVANAITAIVFVEVDSPARHSPEVESCVCNNPLLLGLVLHPRYPLRVLVDQIVDIGLIAPLLDSMKLSVPLTFPRFLQKICSRLFLYKVPETHLTRSYCLWICTSRLCSLLWPF
jgi:hypothetical protein